MAEPTRYEFPAMGSACLLHLTAADADLAAAMEAEVVRLEQRYSRYRPDSVLSGINRAAAAGEAIAVDDETAALLDYAFACHRKSAGRFDITTGILRRAWDFSSGRLPDAVTVASLNPFVGLAKLHWERPRLTFPVPGMELDFGGMVKEYAADRAADLAREAGREYGLVDLGGDLHAIGPQPDGQPWLVHLRHPRRPGEAMGTVPLRRGGLATSGDYERCLVVDGRRYCHILDPETGWPVSGLASVTVVAERCLLAGSLSTIAMLKGRDGAGWLRQLGAPCAWMDDEGTAGGSLLAVPAPGSLS